MSEKTKKKQISNKSESEDNPRNDEPYPPYPSYAQRNSDGCAFSDYQ